MMKKLSLLLLLLLLAIFTSFAQSSDAVGDSINKYVKPILLGSNGQLNYNEVASALFGKEVVSLGEATHGTKEFYEAKTDLIRSLVNHGNFKTIYIESDYCLLLNMNEMLQGASDTERKKLFSGKGVYGIYKTKEVYNLFEFTSQYNISKREQDRVSIVGVDMQDLAMIANRVLNELPDSGKSNVQTYQSLMKMKNLFSNGKLTKFTKTEDKINASSITNLKSMASAKGDQKFIFLIRLLEQSYEMLNAKNYTTRRFLRDKFMAENIINYRENIRHNSKSIVWAHNGHISNIESFGRITMGSYLKTKYKNDLFSLGLFLNKGIVRIIDPAVREQGYVDRPLEKVKITNSFENFLSLSGTPNFFLDFTTLSISKFLTKEIAINNYVRSVGSMYYPSDKNRVGREKVLECFDGILYFENTNAALQLNQL